MLAVGTIGTGTSMCQNTAIEILIKCLQHFTPQSSIVGLKQFFPLIFEILSMMIDYSVQHGLFGRTSGIANELSSRLLPGGIGNSSFHPDILGGGKGLLPVSMIISFRPDLATTQMQHRSLRHSDYADFGKLFEWNASRLSLHFLATVFYQSMNSDCSSTCYNAHLYDIGINAN